MSKLKFKYFQGVEIKLLKFKGFQGVYEPCLDIDKAIDRVAQACHQCAALWQTVKVCEE